MVEEIRDENSMVDIIMITGDADLKRCIEALDLNLHLIFLKQMVLEEILRVISEVFCKT